MPIRQITIIGTGLIGGSFALALRRRRFAGKIVGCDRQSALKRAKMCGVIDVGFPEPADAVRGSQWVLLATPVLAIIDLIGRLGPALPANTLLTDVGSTKEAVARQAMQVFGKNARHRFLAGHPMAGKENSGVDFADADLFQNAVWFLTPLPGQNLQEPLFAEFVGWIDQIGARSGDSSAGGSSTNSVPGSATCRRYFQPRWRRRWWRSFSGGRGRYYCRAGGLAPLRGDDTDCGESVFDVAGYCDFEQEKSGGRAVESGTATGSYPGESGDAATGGGV